MKTFKTYIAESRMTSHGEIVAAIAGYKRAGEILNPAYQDLGSQARRIFGTDTRHVNELILAHMHAGDRSPELNDLYYSWPSDSFASLGKAAKLLAKVKDPKYNNVIKAANTVINMWKPVADDLKELKGKVVKVSQKRAEVKAAAAAVMTGKKADSAALIKILDSHMNEYIQMAKKRATEFVNDKLATLKKSDWDLNKVAPSPHSRMSSSEYKSAQAKRDIYRSITKSTVSSIRPGQPDICEPNHVMIDRYIEMNVRGAEDAYKSFMEKMIQKIGKPVIDAKMTGNIWTNATLTVTCDDGEDQVWSTQMILNFSKYQKMFNQFPSRRKK